MDDNGLIQCWPLLWQRRRNWLPHGLNCLHCQHQPSQRLFCTFFSLLAQIYLKRRQVDSGEKNRRFDVYIFLIKFLPEIQWLAGYYQHVSGTVLTRDKALVEQVETRSAVLVFGSGGVCRQELEAQHTTDENTSIGDKIRFNISLLQSTDSLHNAQFRAWDKLYLLAFAFTHLCQFLKYDTCRHVSDVCDRPTLVFLITGRFIFLDLLSLTAPRTRMQIAHLSWSRSRSRFHSFCSKLWQLWWAWWWRPYFRVCEEHVDCPSPPLPE